MKRFFRSAACVALAAATTLTMSACVNTVDDPASQIEQTAATTTTASQAAAVTPNVTASPSNGQTQPTSAPVDTVPSIDENHSPNISYAVGASAAVDSSYFDDVVFVGDSVSLKLTNYHASNVCFSVYTDFLTSGSLGVANSMWDINREDAVHPIYKGQTVTVVDGIAMSGKSKVYMMLGINDLGLYGVADTVENFKTLTDQILASSPDVTFYIQSVTPLVADYYSLTNAKVLEYNELISEYCREKGWYYIDVASVLRDENGNLIREYCSDPDSMGIHFTDEGCRIWADYLYTHTAP